MTRLPIHVLLKALVLILAVYCESKPVANKRTTRSVPSTVRNVRIQHAKTLHFVNIHRNGSVQLGGDLNGKFAKLQLQSVGSSGEVRIYGKKARRYIAMNAKGDVYTTTQPNKDTMFSNILTLNTFNIFRSTNVRKNSLPTYGRFMHLGFKKDGFPKKGTRSRSSNKASQFIVIAS